ncbi:MAG TPA: uroporphyrinogen decarboxylase family protein [Rectinemataceae bacterium]
MNKMERVRAALAGEPVDRVPYSVWTHFPQLDLDPERLARATVGFFERFDLDFVKNMPNGMYTIEDWDCGCDFSEIPSGGVAKVTKLAVNEPADWERLEEVDIETGALGRELRSLEILLAEMKGRAPVLATSFSPLTTAQKLSGPHLTAHLKSHPKLVEKGLETITAVSEKFAARAIELGCAGLYFASQMSQKGRMDEAGYTEFGIPYDLRVLEAAGSEAWFNVMHIHGNDIMFDLLKSYPVQGISWHVWETAPSVSEFVQANTGKAIVGGLRRYKITEGALSEIAEDVERTRAITKGRRLLLAPGCVIRAPYDTATLSFLRETVTKTREEEPARA